jgi:hypothetical protein
MAIRTDETGGEGVRRPAIISTETDRLPRKNSGKWGQKPPTYQSIIFRGTLRTD